MTLAPGLHVLRITPLCQLQDLGRTGYQRFGVSRCGAMDPYSLRLANILAGNPQDEACLEFALAGAVLEVTAKRLHFAFVGNFPLMINDEPFPANASYTLAKSERLEICASDATEGTHGYLAILGGFAAEPQLGSYSTHLRSGIGGRFAQLERRANKWVPDRVSASPQRFRDDGISSHPGSARAVRDPRTGTVLPTRLDESPLAVERPLPEDLLHQPADTIRAVAGPQTEYFTNQAIDQFFATPWHIAPNSDRMGYRLGGGTVEVEEAGSMISEAVSPGSVQIPAGGEPIVLMADCGTVGGYPKIATVISVDRGRLAQLRVGAEFKFEESTVEAAQTHLREEELRLQAFQDANSRS